MRVCLRWNNLWVDLSNEEEPQAIKAMALIRLKEIEAECKLHQWDQAILQIEIARSEVRATPTIETLLSLVNPIMASVFCHLEKELLLRIPEQLSAIYKDSESAIGDLVKTNWGFRRSRTLNPR